MERAASKLASIVVVGAILALLAVACGSSDSGNEAQADAALASYRSYVEEKSADLVEKTKLLVLPIQAGKLLRAQSFYVIARVPYGQITPTASSFPSLNSHINAQADGEADEFSGFHRIEKGLWSESTTEGISPVAKQLLADVEELHRKIGTHSPEPAQIARAAASTLEGASTAAILGKEERYSESDLVDVAASVEGAGAAFEAVNPLVASQDPELAKEIEKGFAGLYESLDAYGFLAREPFQRRPNAPGVAFYEYSSLSPSDIQKLERKIAQVAKGLSQVPALISQSEG